MGPMFVMLLNFWSANKMNCTFIFIISKHSVLMFYHGENHLVVFGIISEFLLKEIQSQSINVHESFK